MKRHQHIDRLLKQWKFDPHSLTVRMIEGGDGRAVLQMRIDMGLLQMETSGRPDGSRPEGFPSYLDLLRDREGSDPDFVLSEVECAEIDREFVQFYHRRICWLRLQSYSRAVADADHTLRLMEIAESHSPDDDWSAAHEQYRPFVLFHRTQASALATLEQQGPEEAVESVSRGLESIRQVFIKHDVEDQFDADELVIRLVDLRESLRREYDVGRTLQEQLDEAVRLEQYERAAQLRDELARRHVS